MVKEIIWTTRAQNDRKTIFKRNKSNSYTLSLNNLFEESVKIISQFPELGKPTSDQNVRMKIIRDFLMFYEISKDKIRILTIWDSRQNPEKLKI